jgi:hypothetical protein
MKKGRQPNSAWMKTQMDRQPSYVRSGSGVLRVCLAEDGGAELYGRRDESGQVGLLSVSWH